MLTRWHILHWNWQKGSFFAQNRPLAEWQTTQWDLESKDSYKLFEWCIITLFFLPLCAVCHPARCFFVPCDCSVQRAHCQMPDYFDWAVLPLWIQCFLVHCEYSWCNIRNDPINAIQQLFSCYSAAPLNVPVMCLDGFQIKGLQKGNNCSCKQLEYINSYSCLVPFSTDSLWSHTEWAWVMGNWSFWYKLFWWNLKHWNYIKILITSSIVCTWTRKTLILGWIFFVP